MMMTNVVVAAIIKNYVYLMEMQGWKLALGSCVHSGLSDNYLYADFEVVKTIFAMERA
jgi:hypothetical protein